MTTTGNTFDSAKLVEVFLGSGKPDSRSREKGYIVGFNLADTGKVAAWVQMGRKFGGTWGDFGVLRRSKLFDSQEQATRWAYAKAHERMANI